MPSQENDKRRNGHFYAWMQPIKLLNLLFCTKLIQTTGISIWSILNFRFSPWQEITGCQVDQQHGVEYLLQFTKLNPQGLITLCCTTPYPYSIWCPKTAKTWISYIDMSVLLASAGKASWQETTVACSSCYGLEEVQYFFQWLWIPTLKTSDCVFQLFSLSFSPALCWRNVDWMCVCVCTWWVYSKLNWDRLWQSSNPYNQRRRPPSRRRSGRHREKIDHQT